MRNRPSFELHEGGAIAVHVLTGLTAIIAFLQWRRVGGALWPTVLAAAVFAASFVQAALGHDETLWAHVPGALLLMLGSAAVLVQALCAGRRATQDRHVKAADEHPQSAVTRYSRW
jgi:hypothetical protein